MTLQSDGTMLQCLFPDFRGSNQTAGDLLMTEDNKRTPNNQHNCEDFGLNISE